MDNDRSADGCADAAGPACDDDTTAAIARDYLEAAMPVREILARHGLSCGQFYHLAKANGWARRRVKRSKRRKTAPSASAALLIRLRRLARQRIAALEKAANEDAAGLAGHERLAKALTALLVLLT